MAKSLYVRDQFSTASSSPRTSPADSTRTPTRSCLARRPRRRDDRAVAAARRAPALVPRDGADARRRDRGQGPRACGRTPRTCRAYALAASPTGSAWRRTGARRCCSARTCSTTSARSSISEAILLKPSGLTGPRSAASINLHRASATGSSSRSDALAPIRPRRPASPRALRRRRLPRRAARRGDPDRGAHHRRGRLLQRDDPAPPVPRALTSGAASQELERCAGTQFDPDVVLAFVEEVRRGVPAEGARDPLEVALDDPALEPARENELVANASLNAMPTA